MNIKKFLDEYNLHDSLLEELVYDENDHCVSLRIDFCYWQQKKYTEDLPETGMVEVVLKNIEGFIYEPWQINSDEIVKIEFENGRMHITTYNDITDKCYDIVIIGDEIEGELLAIE